MSEKKGTSRRDVLKVAAYVAPAILTFPVRPAAARSGSEENHEYPKQKHYDKHGRHDYDYKKWFKRGWRDRD